eukprot:jgi/Mesen1/10827/ME000093S10344
MAFAGKSPVNTRPSGVAVSRTPTRPPRFGPLFRSPEKPVTPQKSPLWNLHRSGGARAQDGASRNVTPGGRLLHFLVGLPIFFSIAFLCMFARTMSFNYKSAAPFQNNVEEKWQEFNRNKSILERPGILPVKRKPCLRRKSEPEEYSAEQVQSNGYLLVDLNGGLNQQRRGLANAVVVARILNATLVLPKLLCHPIWNDSSTFEELFDVEYFIKVLKKDVKIVRAYEQKWPKDDYELPNEELEPDWYLANVLPELREKGVVWFHTFFLHLATTISPALQRVRCRAQYRALKFVTRIRRAGTTAIGKLREAGPFIAVHMRFEPDQVAHSGCAYEDEALLSFFSKWNKDRKSKYQYKPQADKADANRKSGLCPQTPLDAAIILKALGVRNETIYLAGGEVAGGKGMLAPLYEAFPDQVMTKADLIADSLKEFQASASKLAAIDYLVSLTSDFLLITSGGNMGMMLRGHRFFEGDIKETFQPHMRYILPFMEQVPVDMEGIARTVEDQRAYANRSPLVYQERKHFFDRPSECVCENLISELGRQSDS